MELEIFKEKLKNKEENLFASMDDPLTENVYSFDISSDINFADVNTIISKKIVYFLTLVLELE